MKLRFAGSIAAITITLFSGCANQQQAAMNRAYAEKTSAVQAYIGSEWGRASRGEIKWSDYWTGLYNAVEREPVRTGDLITAKGANQMISAAQQMEAGKLTWTDYEAKRRDVQIQTQQEFDAAKQQFEAAQAQQAQANRAMLMQYYLNTRPITTNCFGYTCVTQ